MLLLHRACSAVDRQQREQEITNHWGKNQQVPRMSNLHTQVQRRHIHRKGLRGLQNLHISELVKIFPCIEPAHKRLGEVAIVLNG